MSVVIWHNPGCSKSRQALALLTEHGCEPTVRKYLLDPPTAEEIRAALKKMGTDDPHALARKREKLYTALGVSGMSGPEVVAAMAENPKLIERPLVITDAGARIGRPTEAILEVL